MTCRADGRFVDARGPLIRSLGFDELQRFDVGRLKPGTAYAKTYPQQQAIDGARIPRLAELFALVRKSGNEKVRFAIETKLSADARRCSAAAWSCHGPGRCSRDHAAMTFSDSDWTRDPPARPRLPPVQRRVLILATAIAVSCVALAVALYGIEQMLDASARSAAPEPIGETVRKAPPGAGAAVPTEVPAATAESAARTSAAPASAASAPDAQPLAALEAEMRQRARETAQQSAAEAARRKERAWQRFYQRPDFCADNPTAAQMVQCANHHIRARKEFEERYAAGRL